MAEALTEALAHGPAAGEPSRGLPRPRGVIAALLIFAFAIGVIYGRSIDAPFVFDDHDAILGNQSIRSIAGSFKPDKLQPTQRRHLVNVSFALNHAAGGLSPRGYRLTNMALHLLNALLLWLVLRQVIASPAVSRRWPSLQRPPIPWAVATGVALIWVCHPLNTDAVAYVTQRTSLLVALFLLLTLYSSQRSWSAGRSTPWIVLAVVSCWLGVFCKELIVAAPLLVPLADWLSHDLSGRELWRKRWPLYVGLAASWLPLAVLIASGGEGDGIGFEDSGVTMLSYLYTQAEVITHYLRLTFWPDPLTISYHWEFVASPAAVVPEGLLIVALLALTGWLIWRRSPWALTGLLFFFLLAPTSSFVPIYTEPAAERRMYLPVVAIIAVLVFALTSGLCGLFMRIAPLAQGRHNWVKQGRPLDVRRIAIAVLLLCTGASLALGHRSARRLEDYRSEERLWRAALAVNAADTRAMNNLASSLVSQATHPSNGEASSNADREARIKEAAGLYARSAEANPRGDTYHNLGLTLAKLGRHGEAVAAYEQALRSDQTQRHYLYLNDLGNALARTGQTRQAITTYERAIAMNPDHAPSHANLGATWLNARQPSKAMAPLDRAVSLNPRDANALLNRCRARLALKQPALAEGDARALVELRGAAAEPRYLLAASLATQGRWVEARAAAEAALQRDPGHRGATALMQAIQKRLGSVAPLRP